jgi:hypothetical protein
MTMLLPHKRKERIAFTSDSAMSPEIAVILSGDSDEQV